MTSYTRYDLEKISEKIIELHNDSGQCPSSSMEQLCKSNDMNPEQIRRLVELTNTGLFLDKFKGTSGGCDRSVDFDVIDPEEILKSISLPKSRSHKSTTISITTPKGTSVRRLVDNSPGLGSDRSWFFDDAPIEKAASVRDIPLDFDVEGSTRVKTASVGAKISPFNEAKLEESLRGKQAEAQIYCDELSGKIASKYRDMYSREKYASYEQDALSIFGPDAVYALQAVRIKLGMPLLKSKPSEDLIKEASDRHIADKNTPGIVETGFFLENLRAHIKVSEALSPNVKTAAFGTDAALTLGASMLAKDFVSPILGATGYQAAVKFGPSAFYRVKGYDRIMESAIDKGLEKAYGTVEKKIEDFKDSYNARKWRNGRMKAVKHLLKNPDIAGADKERVMSAVNTVSRYAPKLSQDPALMSGMVSQMIHSEYNAIDPQTISELVKAEKRFRELDSSTTVNPWS